VDLEFLEGKVRDPVQQAAFVFRGYFFRTIEIAGRKRRSCWHRKQAGLHDWTARRRSLLVMRRMEARLQFRL